MFDGKTFFTIYDFVDAYHHFADQVGWKQNLDVCGNAVCECSGSGPKPQNLKAKTRGRRKKGKRKIDKASDGRMGDSTHDVYFFLECRWQTYFSRRVSNNLFGALPDFSKAKKN
jgi:type I restriction enzyme R subunit